MSPTTSIARSALVIFTIIALATAMNKDQCDVGKHIGYMGSNLTETLGHGDTVTQTYCFCQRPQELRTDNTDDKDLGTLIQIEYYNKDHDTTFGLCYQKLCHHSDLDDQLKTCFMQETTDGIISNTSYWHGDTEEPKRFWPIAEHPNEYIGFGFVANTNKFGNEGLPPANFMWFQGEARNLGDLGFQQYRRIDNGVQDVCMEQCREFLHMEVATFNNGYRQPSFQILNNVLDICPPSGCINA